MTASRPSRESSVTSGRSGSTRRRAARVWSWIAADSTEFPPGSETRIDVVRAIPFVALHVACLGVFFTGASAIAVGTAVALYLARMFAITGFYHRYFSHRTFKTSRIVQFLLALAGATAAQRGPLWWASHHRHHHRNSDEEADLHSPRRRGFWWSHVGWFLTPAAFRTDRRFVSDLARYPELRFLDRFDTIAPALLATAIFLFGVGCERFYPALGTSGWQMLVWGFFISTVVLYHATYTINSLAHSVGRRRFRTADDSRNNWFLALITLGEGWHNNHHRYSRSARQGFYWWEIDLTYCGLVLLSWLGVIRDLKPVPEPVLAEGRAAAEEVR